MDWNGGGIQVFEDNYKNDKLEGKTVNWNDRGIKYLRVIIKMIN